MLINGWTSQVLEHSLNIRSSSTVNISIIQSIMWPSRHRLYPPSNKHMLKSVIIKCIYEWLKQDPFSSSLLGLGIRLSNNETYILYCKCSVKTVRQWQCQWTSHRAQANSSWHGKILPQFTEIKWLLCVSFLGLLSLLLSFFWTV